MTEDPSKLRVPLLEEFGIAEQAGERAQAVLHDSPDWLSDAERSLLEWYLNWRSNA